MAKDPGPTRPKPAQPSKHEHDVQEQAAAAIRHTDAKRTEFARGTKRHTDGK